MYTGKLVFSQVIDHLPMYTFRRSVQRYHGNYKVKSFTCLDQYLSMAFAQLTYRESLRDIEACLRSQPNKLYHMGIRGKVSRNTLSNANKVRDWRIYADFAQSLISIARRLYIDEDFGVELDETVYALDSTTIDLSLSVFPWARFRRTKAAIKLHTLLDLRGSIPTFIHISDGKVHDVNVLDQLIPEPGSFYVMDRAYVDFARLYTMNLCAAFFVIRAKSNFQFRRIYSHPIDKDTGLKCDQTIALTGPHTSKDYPEKLRRIKYHDAQTNKTLVFLTNSQQLHFASADYCTGIQMPLAGRTILQVDKTKPPYQVLLWNHRKCSQNSSMDRSVGLCARCHHQKTAQARPESLHNFAGFECQCLRKNSVITNTYI
jgi:hypothetical protein